MSIRHIYSGDFWAYFDNFTRDGGDLGCQTRSNQAKTGTFSIDFFYKKMLKILSNYYPTNKNLHFLNAQEFCPPCLNGHTPRFFWTNFP